MGINWTEKVAYDNRVRTFGGATATFARDQISNGSAVDTRRYADLAIPVCGVVNWADSTSLPSGSKMVNSGPDRDGTPLLVVKQSGNVTDIYYWDGSGVTRASTTAWTALPEADATTTYAVRGTNIFYGFITLILERFISSVSKGITLCYSQDRGANWTLIESVAGGNQFPVISGDVSSGMTRGASFTKPEMFPLAGLGSTGGHSKTDAVCVGCDYIGATGLPKGGQTFRFDITRADDGDDTLFTVGKARLVFEDWQTGQTSGGTHFHTAGVIYDGNVVSVVTSIGDDAKHNSYNISTFAAGNYETAAISDVEWHGSWDETAQLNSVQPAAAVPFPDNMIGCSADLTPGFIEVIESPADPALSPTLSSRFFLVDDSNSGVFYDSFATLALQWYPGVGWISGHDRDRNGGRFFSADSHGWSNLISDVAIGVSPGPSLLLGNRLLAQKTGSDTLVIAGLPVLRGAKPLLLNPGVENVMETMTEKQAPLSVNTSKLVTYNTGTGAYTYTVGGAVVPNAPSIPPPRTTAQLLEVAFPSTSTSIGPTMWLQDASSRTIDSSVKMVLDVWAFTLSAALSPSLSYPYGNTDTNPNKAPELGYKYAGNQQWHPITRGDTFRSGGSGGTARAQMGRISSGAAANVGSGGTILLAVCGLYSTDAAKPYPLASGISSPGNEKEVITGLTASTIGWTLAVTLGRQCDSLPLNQPLFTAYIDANNFIEVEWLDATEEVRVTTTVGGSAGTPIDVGVGKWLRQFPLHIILSDDDTDLFVSVGSVEGLITHQTGSTETLTTSPTSIRFSNQDQTEVGNVDLYGMGYSPASSSEAERVAALHDQLYMSLPEEPALHTIELGTIA